MKTLALSTLVYLLTLTYAMADGVEYFNIPKENSVYQPGQTVYFSLDDMPDTDGNPAEANLYLEGGYDYPVQNLGRWDPETVGDDSNFAFSGQLDPSLPAGRYYVKIDVNNNDSDDTTRSHTFEVTNEPFSPGKMRFTQARGPLMANPERFQALPY